MPPPNGNTKHTDDETKINNPPSESNVNANNYNDNESLSNNEKWIGKIHRFKQYLSDVGEDFVSQEIQIINRSLQNHFRRQSGTNMEPQMEFGATNSDL